MFEGKQFELGQVVATRGAVEELTELDIQLALSRYVSGDWGDLDESDKEMNDEAVKSGEDRIVAKYKGSSGAPFYIITEWDRSYTTVLLTHEY